MVRKPIEEQTNDSIFGHERKRKLEATLSAHVRSILLVAETTEKVEAAHSSALARPFSHIQCPVPAHCLANKFGAP